LLVSRAAAVFLTRSSAFLLRRFSVRRPLSSRPVFSAFRFSRVVLQGFSAFVSRKLPFVGFIVPFVVRTFRFPDIYF